MQTTSTSQFGRFFGMLEIIFFVIYILEMICKIIALGLLFKRGTYLRDPWNLIDFAIIFASISSFTSQSNDPSSGAINFSSLRVLRILKPLKTIKSIEKLRTLITALLESMPYLADILIIILFTFAVFAIIGLQIFRGSLQYQCVNLATGKPRDAFFEGNACGGVKECPKGFSCAQSGINPQNDIFSFDDFFSSFFMVFIVTSLEGWSLLSNMLMSTTNISSIFFCVTVILIESFFLVNLALAIITVKFCEASSRDNIEAVRNVCSRFDH